MALHPLNHRVANLSKDEIWQDHKDLYDLCCLIYRELRKDDPLVDQMILAMEDLDFSLEDLDRQEQHRKSVLQEMPGEAGL